MKTFRKLLLTLLLIPVLLLGGCGFPGLGGSGNDGTVRIASQTSTESQIMANIIAELINHELGYKTTLVNNLGSGTVVHQAMIRNDADISATRYTGTDITGTLGMNPVKSPSNAMTKPGIRLMASLTPMLSWLPKKKPRRITSITFPT